MCDNIYALDLKTYKWEKLDVSGTPPNHFEGHTSHVRDNKVYIFGVSGVYIFDLTEMKWKRRIDTMFYSSKRFRRFDHASAIIDDKVYIYGGYDHSDSMSNINRDDPYKRGDFLVFDFKYNQWSPIKVKGMKPDVGTQFSDMLAYGKNLLFYSGKNAEEIR